MHISRHTNSIMKDYSYERIALLGPWRVGIASAFNIFILLLKKLTYSVKWQRYHIQYQVRGQFVFEICEFEKISNTSKFVNTITSV